jgi:RHS repeat-associated protein
MNERLYKYEHEHFLSCGARGKGLYLCNETTRNSGQDILQDLNYEYDAVGNITQITDDAQQTHYFNNQVITPTGTYTYDALYRLISATGRELTALTAPTHEDFPNNIPVPNPAANAMQNYNHSYSYDALGNILQDAWKTYEYAIANNYLLGNDNIANQFTYDAHGNTTSMPHLSSMLWNEKDELVSASNGTFISFYNYDAQGNRTRKVGVKNNVREEKYYINGYEVFRKETSGNLDFERKTINISNDEKVFVRIEQKTGESEVIRYQYDNHLGSACLELDENGAIISYEEYHPFGTTSYRSGRSETEVSLKRYKYCGKERDEETGVYYYGMRYYAAWLCRFVSVDPLQFEYSELTPFQYASNNPVTMIDLDGAEGVKPEEKTGMADGRGSESNPIKLEPATIETERIKGTIYLIDLQKGKNKVNTQEVIELTNQRFKDLGLDMTVELVTDPKKFISQEMSQQETYAVLGNVTNVLNYIKEKDLSGYEETFSRWEGGTNSEKSQNVYGKKTMGISIDAAGTVEVSRMLGVNVESFMSLTIMHGAGHNAGMGHDVSYPAYPMDTRKGSAAIMGGGDWLQYYVFAGGHSEIKTIEDIVDKTRNNVYIQEMIRVYNLIKTK